MCKSCLDSLLRKWCSSSVAFGLALTLISDKTPSHELSCADIKAHWLFSPTLCMLFSVVWNIKMCELLNRQRPFKGSQLLQLHNCWIFLQMMPHVIYITINYHNTGHQIQNAGGPSGHGLMRWHLFSSPDSNINGKRFIQALLAIWAIGKVIPHLAFKTEWSILWTPHSSAEKQGCINVWIYTSTFTSTELVLFFGSAHSHLRLVSSFSYCSLYSPHLYLTQRLLYSGLPINLPWLLSLISVNGLQ